MAASVNVVWNLVWLAWPSSGGFGCDLGSFGIDRWGAAALCPQAYRGLADTVVAGEAEYIWPEFCRDFAAGRPKALRREAGAVDPADSPVPRFDLLKLPPYATATLPYSRGCP